MRLQSLIVHGLKGYPQGLSIPDFGKLTSFIGPNASGKTTILTIVEHLLRGVENKKFNQEIKFKDEWFTWSQATLVISSDESGTTYDWNQVETKFIEIEFHFMNNREIVIVRMKSDHGEIKLSNLSMFYSPNPSVAKTEQQKVKKENQLKEKQVEIVSNNSNIQKYPNNQHYRTLLPQLNANVSALESEIQTLIIQLQKENVELISFIDTLKGTEIILARSTIEQFLGGLNCSVRLIEARQNPTQSIDKLLNETVNSKKAEDSDLYFRVKKELSILLEAKVEASEDEKNKKFLTVDRIDHRKISSGTQICLYYYSLIYDVAPNTTIIWDEPENGLHATRRFKILDYFLKGHHQIILGTHATEFTPVSQENCKVYQVQSEYIESERRLSLSVLPANSRKHGFQIAEKLGILPASTLFTANVVIWVEGPSELIFWKKCLGDKSKDFGLVEGFDYTFILYGGSNISNCDINDDDSLVPGFDLLSVCRYPIVLVDSDISKIPNVGQSGMLKKGPSSIRDAIHKLNIDRPDSAIFEFTAGRELENYFPDQAIRDSVQGLGNYTPEEIAQIKFESFELSQYERYFEAVEEYIVARGLCFVDAHNTKRAKHYTNWGEKNKLEFVKTAILSPSFSVDTLKYNGATQVKRIIEWISRRRVDKRPKID